MSIPPATIQHTTERVHTYFPVVAPYNFLGADSLEDLSGARVAARQGIQ